MRTPRTWVLLTCALALAACDDSTGLGDREGRMVVRMTDAPFPISEVSSVDVFVVRVDGKLESTSEVEAETDVDVSHSQVEGWVSVAEPNARIDLLTLQNGNTTTLGQTTLRSGTYHSLRIVLDVSKSSITLKNGTTLTSTSSPSIVFPSAGKSGIKVLLDEPIEVAEGATTVVLIDFDVGESFVMRGNTITQNGLLFRPVIKAKVIED